MSVKKNTVVLFEDNPRDGEKIESFIRNFLPEDAELIRFVPQITATDKAYEDRLTDEIKQSPYCDATLIVSDRDLSSTDKFRGLSEAVVSKVANQLGIPIALYASGYSDDLLERQKQFGDARIVLDARTIGPQVAVLVQGFAELKQLVPKVLGITGEAKPRSPAGVMAQLLGHPELVDHISLYGSGDQKMIAEVLPFAIRKQKAQFEARLPSLVGYWLYDSMLRFPGLVVNSVAAASYLNIAVKAFEAPAVRALFKQALYQGPFRDSDSPLWWRGVLDQIIQGAGCTSGDAVVKKLLGKDVEPCLCSVNPNRRAGWYCIATKSPVSLEESEGNISWFPAGADLARIRRDVYDEVGPWLGLN